MRDREEVSGDPDKTSTLCTSIEYQDFERAMFRMHVLWSSAGTLAASSGNKNQLSTKPAVEHTQRILNSLGSISSQSFDQFLGKFETKSLKGYSTRALKHDSSKGTLINTDLQDLADDQPTVKKEISKKIDESKTIKVEDLEDD